MNQDHTAAVPAAPTLGRLAFVVFAPFAAGYFLSYVYRSTNAVIAPQLVAEIGLSASDLGFLTSMYFLTFSLFQLPLGILLDRYGPRRVQTVLLLVAASGAALYAIGTDMTTLAIGRGLVGIGVSGCLMASLTIFTIWYPERLWPMMNGLVLGIGGLGAAAATTPLEMSLAYTDWRGVYFGLAGMTVLVSLLIFSVVPEHQRTGASASLATQVRELGQILTSGLYWRLVPVLVVSLSVNLAIQTLWAGPWLRDVAGFDRDRIAGFLFILAIALTVGSIIVGVAATRLEKAGVPLLTQFFVAQVGFLGCQALIALGLLPQSLWPWIGFGFFANVAMLVYPVLFRAFPKSFTGRVSTGINVLVFGGVFLTQYLIGTIIDLWPEGPGGGYHPEAYTVAFGAVIAAQIFALAWALLFRPDRWSR